jgi:hypothetical protein
MNFMKKVKEFFSDAWKWIEALWDKHDEYIEEMVKSVLPMVIDMAFRNDLSGEDKKKAIVDAILDGAEVAAGEISKSMLNEAIEIAASRYNIQIGKLTAEKMDNALNAALEAGRKHADHKLDISGKEAEEAGIVLSNDDVG